MTYTPKIEPPERERPQREVIITGASRGIGAALARTLGGPGMRLVLLARDAERLADVRAEIVARGGDAVVVVGDLSSVAGAHRAAERIGDHVSAGATLVQNAGVWPSKRRLSPEGLEIAFVVNHLAPQVLTEKLLAAGRLSRMLVLSAGLIVKGRFDPDRSPTGDDFSAFRTYCTTKLCSAVAARSLAARHPALDVCVLHPGVVRTDLGACGGTLGAVIRLVKRRWEDPSVTAKRLARILAEERWSEPGHAQWRFEQDPAAWPDVAQDETLRTSVERATHLLLAAHTTRICQGGKHVAGDIAAR